MNQTIMELTYMVQGADSKEYGPASLAQLSAWVREGRLLPQAGVRRSDMEDWAAAADFTELQPLFGSVASGPVAETTQVTAVRKDPGAAARVKSAASWFYLVAVLSLVNTITAFIGIPVRFIVGLGITQVFDEFASALSGGGKIVALLLDVAAAGIFVLFGIFANKAHKWAFIVGGVLFALDGLIFLAAQDWLGVGFHVLVLFFLFRGFNACRRI